MEIKVNSVEEIIKSAHEYINNFRLHGKFLIINVIEKIAKNNKPYISLDLKDKTGVMRAKRFTNGNNEFNSLKSIYIEGNAIEIEGIYQYKWGSVNIKNEILLKSDEYELSDFEEPTDINLESLKKTLMDTIDLIEDDYLKKILEMIFFDEQIREPYFTCPASVGMHHSYKHGNLEHVISMIKLFQRLEKNYEKFSAINSDLVYTGIILHDIGKIKEFSINYGIPVRNQGYGLIGHFSLGEEIILKYVRMINNFPEDLEWKLRHIILSHHGRKEYGSSVEPQIPEAEIIYHLDSLDANYKKINFL